MQNFHILREILQYINLPLCKWSTNININKLAKYAIDGLIKNYRQTIITSSIVDTQFISLINNFKNYRTFIKLFINNNDNILSNIKKLDIKQYFKRIECDNFLNIEDCIINFFSSNVIRMLTNVDQLIIYAPSYLEYIRLSDLLKKNEIIFKGINEYTQEKKKIKIIKLFKFKKIPILLITGRLLFYERFIIKDAKQIIFYSPPKFSYMYFELIKNLKQNCERSSICYYTKYHTYELERIIGIEKTIHLINQKIDHITLYN